MPRNRGTSRKGKPKKGERAAGMGRALAKSQQARYRPKQNGSSRGAGMAMAPGTYNLGVDSQEYNSNTKSVLEMDDLTDFLQQANMAGRQFESEKERNLILDAAGQEYNANQTRVTWQDQAPEKPSMQFNFSQLSVPRRPEWDESTSPEQLNTMEKESLLEWRRAIAQKEEEIMAKSHNISVTPFEKNLEVWRQLWRVLERCSCLIQIVDGRNPLFYLSRDLQNYATQELKKPMILCINKSDYLSEKQRRAWSVHLKRAGWQHHVFFSAHQEQQKLDTDAAQERKRAQGTSLQYDPEEQVPKEEEEGTNEQHVPNTDNATPEKSQDVIGINHPLTRQGLLDYLQGFATIHSLQPDSRYQNRIQFGMVGFPNVGKSSVINVLMGVSKHTHGLVRVGVASQPGKTKHFQTLLLPGDDSQIMLCDCPGLVFPSFVSSTADLIAAGVFPIAQMRDHWPVVELICQRIPREVLNAHYGITLPTPTVQDLKERGLADPSKLPPPTAEELLTTYCIARSMLAAASGVPDYQRAARVVIKDYAEGKLLYCHAPPNKVAPSSEEKEDVQDNDDDASFRMNEDEYHCETLLTSLHHAKKLRNKLTPLLTEQQQHEDNTDGNKNYSREDVLVDDKELGLVDIEDDLDLLDVVGGFADKDNSSNKNEGNKRGKKHKTMHKHGKKGRKDRNKDPYGCHSDPNETLMNSVGGGGPSGVIVKAGKYGRRGYTRPDYSGIKGAVQYSATDSGRK